MNRTPDSDAGFVLLDALMATALIALAGTTVVLISTQMLRQQDAALDRSVALTMAQTLMHQYLLLGPPGAGQAEPEDELFSYRIVRDGRPVPGTSLLEAVAILAEAKSGQLDASQRLDFLAPVTKRERG